MKLLSTPREIPDKGFSNLVMNSPSNNQHLPLHAVSSLDNSLDTSQPPIDMADMSSFNGSHMLPYESQTPDSSPSPNLVSIHKLPFRIERLLNVNVKALSS